MISAFSLPLATDGWNGDPISFWGMREPVSALTHFVGAVFALAAAGVLWERCRGDRPKQVSMGIYAGSLILLFFASALYHVVRVEPRALANFRRADHAAIFILIAGTYTPFYFNAVGGWWRLGHLVAIWLVAVAGIVVKIVWIDIPDWPSAAMYIAMGWLAIVSLPRFARALSNRAMVWTGVGGVLYTAGAAFDSMQWPVPVPGFFGFHETFHVCVMLAATTHFWVIITWVAPVQRPPMRRVPLPET